MICIMINEFSTDRLNQRALCCIIILFSFSQYQHTFTAGHSILITCYIYRYNIILGPEQNGRHFTDGIFKCIFLKLKLYISVQISVWFIPYGPVACGPASVQIMAYHRTGNKPLLKPMMSAFEGTIWWHQGLFSLCGRLIARSREVSKPRDSASIFSNHSGI